MTDPLKREPVAIPPRISFSPKVRLEVLLKSNGRCACCAIKLADRFDVDHIIPRANGGANSLGNLQALCVDCHRAKTPGDITCAAKAKRQSKMGDPKPPSRIRSRPFAKSDTPRKIPSRPFARAVVQRGEG